jgi:hypothetical protein
MQTKPDFELIKRGYAIIDGIPEDRFYLDGISSNSIDLRERGNPHHCGTIGCAMGWFGMHPDMQARGLKAEPAGGLSFNGQPMLYTAAASALFGISHHYASELFSPLGCSDYDSRSVTNHKRAFQRRVKKFLREHGQL